MIVIMIIKGRVMPIGGVRRNENPNQKIANPKFQMQTIIPIIQSPPHSILTATLVHFLGPKCHPVGCFDVFFKPKWPFEGRFGSFF